MFTIFTGIASLGVLSFLFFDFGKKFIYFIIAFEVGVFILIAYCIYKIITGDKKKKDNKDKYVVRFDECPDYYSKKIINGEDYCFNEYLVKDKRGNSMLIKLSPYEMNGTTVTPETTTKLTNIVEPSAQLYSKFQLHKLEKDDNIPKFEDKCKLLFNNTSVSDPKYSSYLHYPHIPYTYAKSRCASLAE